MIQNYKKIYEFLLWDNCNNNCKFCFQRKNPRLFNQKDRKYILNQVIEFIHSDKFIKGSHILICGGEIFDKPSDFCFLNKFFHKIIELMLNDYIDLLYINTNLIYKNIKGLSDFLDIIKDFNLFDRLKFTTSYDIAGRFKSEEDKQLVLDNIKYINITYPNCNIVTNIILTKQACESIINKELSIKSFMNTYNCWVNLIPYIVLDKNLEPTRTQVFKALLTVDNECTGYLDRYIPNMSITQEKLLYMYKNNEFQFCSCPISSCGHSVNFKKYSSKKTCFCCDLKEIFNIK